MAKNDPQMEPAFCYAIVFTVASLVLTGFGAGWLDDGLSPLRLVIPAAYGLMNLGLIGAMAEPLPKDPGDGAPGFRLRLCWGILALCPPPSRMIRALLAVAASCALGSAVLELDQNTVLALSLGFLLAISLGRPKDILELDFLEAAFLLATTIAGIFALVFTTSDVPSQVQGGLWTLGLLALLHAQRARELTALRWKRVLPGMKPPPALDLSRWEIDVERVDAPSAPAVLPAGVEEQLVDRGSFRVDASKMLEKLSRRQLADPLDFIAAWMRCAAASGAEEMRLTTDLFGVTFAFEGRPFSAGELGQPYQALIEADGEDGRRARHFAYGLLALYRLNPAAVSVASRGPIGTARMTVGAASALDAPERDGTSIRVSWPWFGFYWRPQSVATRAKERFGLGPARLRVDGSAVPDRPEGSSWKKVAKDGWRGVKNLDARLSRVRIYVLGTFIEEVSTGKKTVDAWLTHEDLELDISQSSVVRGALLERGLKLVPGRFD